MYVGLEEDGHRKRDEQEQRPGGGTWQVAQDELPTVLCSGARRDEMRLVRCARHSRAG